MFFPLSMFCCRSTSVTIMDVFTEIGHEIWVATTTGEQATPSGKPPRQYRFSLTSRAWCYCHLSMHGLLKHKKIVLKWSVKIFHSFISCGILKLISFNFFCSLTGYNEQNWQRFFETLLANCRKYHIFVWIYMDFSWVVDDAGMVSLQNPRSQWLRRCHYWQERSNHPQHHDTVQG